MFSVALKNLEDKKELLERAGEAAKITIRGYDLRKVELSPELRKGISFPINKIVSDYKKIGSEFTWERIMGRIVDQAYCDLYEKFFSFLSSLKVKKIDLGKKFEEHIREQLKKIRELIEKETKKLKKGPKRRQKDFFLKKIEEILRFESEICNTLLKFKTSIKKDINIKGEAAILFPFVIKPKFNTKNLGFSEGIEADFLYDGNTVGEIKTGEWRNSFWLYCTAYALAYENEHKKNMDFMIILNPDLATKRGTPLYQKFGFVVIEDIHRKTVLALRDKKIEEEINKSSTKKNG